MSAEDSIPCEQAPWIGRAIERWANRGKLGGLSLGRRIQREQTRQQQIASSHRWRLLQTDSEEEKLLADPDESPHKCFAL
jgi:hypothetical protein